MWTVQHTLKPQFILLSDPVCFVTCRGRSLSYGVICHLRARSHSYKVFLFRFDSNLPSLQNRTHTKSCTGRGRVGQQGPLTHSSSSLLREWSIRLPAGLKTCFNCGNKLTTKWIRDTSSKVLHAPKSDTPKPIIRKNRDRVPRIKCLGTTFGVLRLICIQQNER